MNAASKGLLGQRTVTRAPTGKEPPSDKMQVVKEYVWPARFHPVPALQAETERNCGAVPEELVPPSKGGDLQGGKPGGGERAYTSLFRHSHLTFFPNLCLFGNDNNTLMMMIIIKLKGYLFKE